MAKREGLHGSHATVDFRTYSAFDEKTPRKGLVHKQYGVGCMATAQLRVNDLYTFATVAEQCGIPLPTQTIGATPGNVIGSPSLSGDGIGGPPWVLHIVQENAGPTMTDVIKKGADSDPLIDMYLGFFKRVADAGHIISLDPPLANFAANTGALIDIYPPRHALNTDKPLIEYALPPDLPPVHYAFMYERYYGDRQAVVLYAQILRALNGRSGPDTSKRIIDKIDHHLGGEAATHVHVAVHSTLDTVGPTDVDVLRAVGSTLKLQGNLTQRELDHLFKLTHIEANTGRLPSQDDIEAARQIVISCR